MYIAATNKKRKQKAMYVRAYILYACYYKETKIREINRDDDDGGGK